MRSFLYLMSILVVLSSTSCVSSSSTTSSISNSDSSEADLVSGSKMNVQLGVGYMQRGQYKVAKEKLEKAIDQDPDNLQAYTTIALLMDKLNEKDKAEEYYLEAISLKPDNTWLHNSYGAFLCGTGRLDDAMEEFKIAYNDPFYETAYLAKSNAGSCLVQNGKYKEAESLLRTALRTDNKLSGALLSMAEIGVETNRYLMSRAYIQRYHLVKQPSSESLWIQIQAERALKAKEHYLKYAKQLLNNFPDSDEAGLLADIMRKDNIN